MGKLSYSKWRIRAKQVLEAQIAEENDNWLEDVDESDEDEREGIAGWTREGEPEKWFVPILASF